MADLMLGWIGSDKIPFQIIHLYRIECIRVCILFRKSKYSIYSGMYLE